MSSYANYLFLLIANLSQQRNRKQIITMFIDCLNALQADGNFYWSEDEETENAVPVSTRKNSFGYINCNINFDEWGRERLAVFQNSVQMLAVILERLVQENLLSEKKVFLEKLVNERTYELKEQNEEYLALNEELQEAFEKIEVSESKFKSYIDNAPDGVFIANEKGGHIEVNKAACRITGYSEDELLHLSIPELIQEEYLEKAKNHFQTLGSKGFASGEFGFVTKSGEKRFWTVDAVKLSETRFLGFAKDTTERKRIEEVLEKRVVALTRPLDSAVGVTFEELFNIDDIQQLQDQFAEATGVASIITHIDGTPITKPSNFCRLCSDIIRKTDKGLKNCFKSDAALGEYNTKGPSIQPCLSGGLWDAGAAITVGGKHIANWLIGQVRDETQTDEKMRAYARKIGANEDAVSEAFNEVPAMTQSQFNKVSQAVFTLANQLSVSAYQNVQQARFISERKQAEKKLHSIEWMLSKKTATDKEGIPVYGDVSEHNKNGLILTSVGKDMLTDVVSEYLDLLETSAAVYEKNGEYALGIFSSGWCQLMDSASRQLCNTKNNQEALDSGQWLCHESCWQCSHRSMKKGQAVEINCVGGIKLYAVPIVVHGEVVGAVNFGYGNPPTDETELKNLSEKFNIPLDKLRKNAEAYNPRPQFIIDYAKERIQVAAKNLGFFIERKQAEDALQESELKLRNIFENSTNLFYSHNIDHVITYLSPQVEKLLGYTQEEAMIKWTELTSENPINEIGYEHTVKAIETGKPQQPYEVELIHKNGKKVWVEVREAPVVKDGKTVSIVGALIDITEQKQAEQEIIKAKQKIEESELTFRKLFEDSSDAILLIDKTGVFVECNQAALDLLKMTREAFLFQPPVNISPEFQPNGRKSEVAALEMIELAYKKGVHRFDWTCVNSEGGEFIVEVSLMPIKLKGEIMLYTTWRDITKRISQENELKKAKEKAEESDRLKSAFLTNMSHEIRTPMNGILGFADLLKKPQLTGEEQEKYIGIIEKSGNRMLNIINDIIDISKIEAGLMEFNVNETNINQQIEDIYNFFKPEADAKGLQLAYKIALPAEEATIFTDSEKLYAILTNFVKNAIKYTQRGSIELGYALKTENTPCNLEFYVKDTGIGIPKNRQQAIFKRFIQADIADKMAQQGAGLGLAITKSYIEKLGGKIWVESDVGKLPAGKAGGSTFYFTLPYNTNSTTKTNALQPKISENNKTIKKLKILIAEDDEVSEKLLNETITTLSKEILNVSTGIEAVEACRNNPDIDLILMDVRMPNLNGYEATQQIRDFNKEVIIIAQTAYGLSGDREKAIEAGCNDYIAKPIKQKQIQTIVQKYFGE